MFSNSEILIRNCSFPGIFEECSVEPQWVTFCSGRRLIAQGDSGT